MLIKLLVLIFRSSLSVVLFTSTNEVQHVPDNWLVDTDKCWFPYLKADCKEKFLSAAQISKMIKKCSAVQNNEDGTIHQITKKLLDHFVNKINKISKLVKYKL